MLSALATTKKVTGFKQTKRAVMDGRAASVYIAEDAEMRLRLELSNLCMDNHVPQIMIESMKELGHACGLRIGASSAAVLR